MMAALLRLFVTFLSLALRILLKLRLGIPLLYTILMITVCSEWSAANNALAVGIVIPIVATAAASWVVTLARKVQMV